MSRVDIPRAELEAVLERYNGCLTRTAAHLSEHGHAITKEGLRKKCKRMGVAYNRSFANYDHLPKLRAAHDEFPTYDRFERVTGDALVVSDLHCPFFSPEWVGRALEVAKAQRIRQVVIAGDVLDGKSVSSWKCQDRGHTLQMEFTAARQLLMAFLERFDAVYLLTGNHDERVARFTDNQFDLAFLYQHIVPDQKLKVSDYAWCMVGSDIRVTHPYNYSSVPGAVPRALASKYHQHIIMGHTHRYAYTFDPSGRYVACEIGGLFDASKMDWQMLKDNRAPMWNNGFAMVKDGDIVGFHEGTHWEVWI